MCIVVQYAYQKCHHHHHWEPAIECDSGFDSTSERCSVGDHQVICVRYLPPGQPLFCKDCFDTKVHWIKQAFYVMLIKLKAATIAQSSGTAELGWRYRTWKVQVNKELVRMALSCGYLVLDASLAGNVHEDVLDPDWHFPLPEAEVQAQLSELNLRVGMGGDHPAQDFLLGIPDVNYEPVAIYTDDGDEDDDNGTSGPSESAIPHTRTESDSNSEEQGNENDGTLP